MNENPYSTPQADVRQAVVIRKGSRVKAIAIGMLVDLGGTTAASFVLGIVYGIVLAASGMPPERIQEHYAANYSPFAGIGLCITLVGLGCSVLGGHLCARIVRERELYAATWMAALTAGYSVLLANGELSPAVFAAMLALTVAAIFGGAALGRYRNAREAAGLG
ncbi:MAG: hypothetical protein K0R03_2522 [Moraxellaceae bacterium]|jgi:nitrate/nitrite transporter NarK|nr:hypothetical protein [Moraxellaceae bacterium]